MRSIPVYWEQWATWRHTAEDQTNEERESSGLTMESWAQWQPGHYCVPGSCYN